MPAPLSGPGVGLPINQNLYPSELNSAPYDVPSNRIGLAPGDSLVLPAGNWYINTGMYCIIQFLDPITGVWAMGTAPGWQGGTQYIKSDGFNIRIANLLGCPVSAVVVNGGSAYVQATTTITQIPGNGTWLPIVGGALAVSGGTATSIGGGYGVAPIILIPPPPAAAQNANGVGGVAATAYTTISGGTLSGCTLINTGAGYPVAPTPVIVPSPFDPNLSTGITQGTVTFTLTGSGSLTGALCTNSGAPLANPAQVTLSVGGAGSSASLTANVLQTITAASVSGAGIGYGVSATIPLITAGGAPVAGSFSSNPDSLHLSFRPRPAQITATTTSGTGTLTTQLGTIIDGGLFLSTPVASVVPTGIVTTLGTIALTMGNVPDNITIQNAP